MNLKIKISYKKITNMIKIKQKMSKISNKKIIMLLKKKK